MIYYTRFRFKAPKAAPIGETEIRLIQARKTPNGVAARAIMRSGSGHKYWSDFSQDKQEKIEKIAQEINSLIFQPKLSNPIKTKEKKFGSLKFPSKKEAEETQGQKFSRETKSAAFIREALRGCPKCKICGGYLPSRFNTIDHIKRKADGGLGTLANAQLTHPYCNTTYKN